MPPGQRAAEYIIQAWTPGGPQGKPQSGSPTFPTICNPQKTKKPGQTVGLFQISGIEKPGAGEGIRTLDPDLGKVVLYH
jgi:hypothetical protein